MKIDNHTYSAGMDYTEDIKVFSPEEIANDIKNWKPEDIESAFIAVIIKNYPTNWNEIREQLKKGFGK
jgi:hypothetical protein